MSAATPAAQAAASPAAARTVALGETLALALSLASCVVGTFALVYYGILADFNATFIASWALGALIFMVVLWRRFGAVVAWIALLLMQLSLICASIWRMQVYLAQVVPALAPPAAAYLLCRVLGWRARIFAVLLAACLAADLWRYSGTASALYAQPTPATRGADLALAAPSWPAGRSVAPPQWLDDKGQAERNPELVLRRAFAFAAPMADQALSFDKALTSERWATYLLGKGYFRLIHSGLPPAVIREFMAVDRPLFQFKNGAVVVPDQGLPGFFAGLPAGRAAALLRCYAVLAHAGGSSWAPLMVSPRAALARSDDCRSPAFSLSVVRSGDNGLQADYRAGAAGVLYWSDGYDSRWRAFVDREEVPIARAGEAFKALPLPAGAHRLRLSYEPRWFELGLALHYAAFAACVLAALAISWWSRGSRSR